MFENVDGRTDNGWTDGRRSDWYTISSPMSLRLRCANKRIKIYHIIGISCPLLISIHIDTSGHP